MQNTKKMTVSDSLANLAQSEDDLAFLEGLEDASPQSCPKTPEEVDQFYRDNVKLLHSIVRPYRVWMSTRTCCRRPASDSSRRFRHTSPAKESN